MCHQRHIYGIAITNINEFSLKNINFDMLESNIITSKPLNNQSKNYK